MIKLRKIIPYIVAYCILFYLLNYYLLDNFKIDDDSKATISLMMPLIICVCIYYVIKIFKNKNDNKIKRISEKYKRVIELNNQYNFIDIGKKDRTIYEKEYSHKSYDKVRADSIILYRIENNEDGIRDFILNAYRNKKKYDEYLKKFEMINEKTDKEIIEKEGLTETKFKKIENRVIEKTKISDKVYNISIHVTASYITSSGRNTYQKSKLIKYEELCDIYMRWHNGKKYDETTKFERKQVNDDLRYDVLKETILNV